MNRLAWIQVTSGRWKASVIDFVDGTLFDATIERGTHGYHVTITATQDQHPEGATYHHCNSLQMAKEWTRRAIMTAGQET